MAGGAVAVSRARMQATSARAFRDLVAMAGGAVTCVARAHTSNESMCVQTRHGASELHMVLYLGMYMTWLHAEMWHKTKQEAEQCLSLRTEWGEQLTPAQREAFLRTLTLFKIGKGAGEHGSSFTWVSGKGATAMQAEAAGARTGSINATIRSMPRHSTTQQQPPWMHLFANGHVTLFDNCMLRNRDGFFLFTPHFRMMAQVVVNNVCLHTTNTSALEKALAAEIRQRVTGVERVEADGPEFLCNEVRGWPNSTRKPADFPVCGREWFQAWHAWNGHNTLCAVVAMLVQAARKHTQLQKHTFASALLANYDEPGSMHYMPFARQEAWLHIAPSHKRDDPATDCDCLSDNEHAGAGVEDAGTPALACTGVQDVGTPALAFAGVQEVGTPTLACPGVQDVGSFPSARAGVQEVGTPALACTRVQGVRSFPSARAGVEDAGTPALARAGVQDAGTPALACTRVQGVGSFPSARDAVEDAQKSRQCGKGARAEEDVVSDTDGEADVDEPGDPGLAKGTVKRPKPFRPHTALGAGGVGAGRMHTNKQGPSSFTMSAVVYHKFAESDFVSNPDDDKESGARGGTDVQGAGMPDPLRVNAEGDHGVPKSTAERQDAFRHHNALGASGIGAGQRCSFFTMSAVVHHNDSA